MSDFAQTQASDRRRILIDALYRDPHYASNHVILKSILDRFGHFVSSQQIFSDLLWLQENSLVTLQDLAGIAVATLTSVGLDLAENRTFCPGVRRGDPPDPS
ncbi:MAG: ArsR family transcriptional regulator [Magnetococcales bacterium]|nr:ArsR family transcriptional regulator [Magnetococcales bacterium]